MRRSLGLTWFAAALTAGATVSAAAGALFLEGGAPLGLAAVMLGTLACVLALAATPLALAPAEALRASLAARHPGAAPWGVERQDIWGALARDIAAATTPAEQDQGIDLRRLAANLELTLRQTGEELSAVRARMGDAAATLEGAAAAGERLSGVAAEATRQLASAVQRTDDATGALAVLPALASEQAASIEKAAARSLAAAEALAQAALRPPASVEPRGDELALRDAALHGAETARRLGEAMPLLVEAVARLPVAAASQGALAETATRLAAEADRLGAGLARVEALPEALSEALLPAAREAADAVAGRVADVTEVMALQAAWRAQDSAEKAALRLEAAGGAPAAGALAEIVDRAEGLLVRLENLGVAPATLGVGGEGRLDALADRLAADLSDGAPAEVPMTLLSLEETIRRLQDPPDDAPPAR
jgi:hypothetical protein